MRPAAGAKPKPKPAPKATAPSDSVPATIGALISELKRTICELEKHTADITYPGTDGFNAHKFPRHPFDDSAYTVLDDLAARMEELSNDFYGAAQERQRATPP